jgi:1,2-diacylglycerol 3-alpha-glucosyltransferase
MSDPRDMSNLRVAVASSGLGHIRRGIETWADDIGAALRRHGVEATTFQGGNDSVSDSHLTVPCVRRFDPRAQSIVHFFRPLGGWRYGLGSGYTVEQTTFALNLWRKIGRSHDLLHVQDPQVALIFERLNRIGLSRPRVILGHGTEEDAEFLKRFSYLQHLAPNYLEDWESNRPARQLSFAVPNFVDTTRFRPGDKRAARATAGIPQDALVFLSVGALKKTHKRVDYLIREFSSWRKAQPRKALLIVAGAREAETDEILRLRAELDPEAVQLLENVPRDRIATLLQAADVFTLGSLHEMMPIAVLEALSSGLPIACNDDPTLRWMVGDAGRPTNISLPGALASQFEILADPNLRQSMSNAARTRAETVFSEEAVINEILEMYRVVATH